MYIIRSRIFKHTQIEPDNLINIGKTRNYKKIKVQNTGEIKKKPGCVLYNM